MSVLFVCMKRAYHQSSLYYSINIYTYNNKLCLNTFASTQCILKPPQWLLSSSAKLSNPSMNPLQHMNILKATMIIIKAMEAHARTTGINLLHYKVPNKSINMVIKQILLRISILAMLKVLARRNDPIMVYIYDF